MNTATVWPGSALAAARRLPWRKRAIKPLTVQTTTTMAATARIIHRTRLFFFWASIGTFLLNDHGGRFYYMDK
ncbi:MAG: hypothetical protein B6I34_06545 [Anaerolineaceae bacterium 4572_32.1]|nr:MAG: hypothetical protein B6I34_06545 [Anaerolineaceae bacterium 4572_32.1]